MLFPAHSQHSEVCTRVHTELNALVSEINAILASCSAFWPSVSDVPLLSKRMGQSDLQQLQYQLMAFIESVRCASRWGCEGHAGPTTVGLIDGKHAVMDAEDHQHTAIGVTRPEQTNLPIAVSRGPGAEYHVAALCQEVTMDSERTHSGLEASATATYRDIAVMATLEATPLLVYYRKVWVAMYVAIVKGCIIHGANRLRAVCSAILQVYAMIRTFGRRRASVSA